MRALVYSPSGRLRSAATCRRSWALEKPAGRRAFSQLGAEIFHINEAGKITAFWAVIDDTSAFDDFFAD